MAFAQQPQAQMSSHDRERVEQFREERRYIVKTPIACYYAILVGLILTPLGIAGLVPQFTEGGLLFHVLRDSIGISCVYLVTGLAGLFAGTFRGGHYAHLYTLILTGLYLFLFSSGNIAFGNAEGTTGGPPDFPWIFENAIHAGLMLTGALITGLSALQRGDRATAEEYKMRYGITDQKPGTASHSRKGGIFERLHGFAGFVQHGGIRTYLKDWLTSLICSGALVLAATALSLAFSSLARARRRQRRSNGEA